MYTRPDLRLTSLKSRQLGLNKSNKIIWEVDQRCEEAVVRKLIAGPAVVVLLIFGTAHDFSDEFQQLAPDPQYVRVTVQAWPV